MAVILETSIGDITVDLYCDERPRCCLNFLKLCKIKYYNFHLFHSVQPNFIAQTGDPTGTGRGGESIFSKLYGHQAQYFEAELKPRIKHIKRGTISMVNDGNNRHGSQFFLTLAESNDYLDKQNHTVFGEVAEGFEILEKLNNAIIDEKDRPLKDVRIYHTVILDDPFPDPPGLGDFIPDSSPEANTQEQLSPRIGADEDTDDEKDLDPEEIEERNRERKAKIDAQILTLVGDIPDADVKPPDNVLFVCKLNPVTTDEDLEIIFSSFGKVLSCEVIRNQKTNESLQYAFVEFEDADDCVKAYFKMDNVLIDDRRIHVDFSQSVSKIQWKRPEKDDQKPQYRIKEFEKKNDGYQYVFEEPESERRPEKKSKTKKSKKVRERSSSQEDKQTRRYPSSGAERRSDSLSRKENRRLEDERQPRDDKMSVKYDRKRRSPSLGEERGRRHVRGDDDRRRRSPSREVEENKNRPRRRREQRSPSEHGRRSRSRDRHQEVHKRNRRDESKEREHKRKRRSSSPPPPHERDDSNRRRRGSREKEQKSRRR